MASGRQRRMPCRGHRMGVGVVGIGEHDALVHKPREPAAEGGSEPLQVVAAPLVDRQEQQKSWRRLVGTR